MTTATAQRTESGLAPGPPHPIRKAFEAGDLDAMARTLAPDVSVRSPVTGTPFVGPDGVDLLRNVMTTLESWECVEEQAGPEFHVLVTRARLGGRTIEYIDLLRHDEKGRIKELTIYGRPISDMALFAKYIGPKMARRRGRLRALAVAGLTRPLPRVLRLGDATVRALGLNPRRLPDDNPARPTR